MELKKSFILIILILSGLSPAQHDYARALHLSTYFLGAQRCGDTQSWIHPDEGCHLTDGQSESVDLTGGWHDCGDYIKFDVTGPYAGLMYLYGYDKYPDAYPDNYTQDFSAPPPNGIPDVIDEVKIQTDYLIKKIDGDRIFWQVGDGRDHNSFTEPVTSGKEGLYDGSAIRPVFSATEGHSNALGGAAAVLALMSILYEPFDSDYADSCLQAAVKYYSTGRINAGGTGSAADPFYSYMAANWRDDMGLGAIMLYRATGTDSYLEQAREYANSLDATHFSYTNINAVLHFEMFAVTKDQNFLSEVASVVNGYSLNSCGYTHRADWGSLRDAGNAAMISALYHMQTGNEHAYNIARGNIDFILGDHTGFANVPANYSFMTGYDELGGGYPTQAHHGAAFGKTADGWSLYNQAASDPGSVEYEYELTGAIPGGPGSSCGDYHDVIDDFRTNEHCHYYNAAFNSALAYIHLVEDEPGYTGTGQLKTGIPLDITVHPGSNQLIIHHNDSEIQDLRIMDVKGKTLLSLARENIRTTINISEFTGGIYFVKVITSESWGTKQIIIY